MSKYYFTINEYATSMYEFNATEDDEKMIEKIGLEKYIKNNLRLIDVFNKSKFIGIIDFIESEQETIQEF